MARIDGVIHGLAGLIICLGFGGCLSTPTGIDCAETPGAAGCAGESLDGASDRAPPPLDVSPADAGPADGSPPDARPGDAGRPDEGPPDARPADAAADAGPEPRCAEATCPAPPVDLACFEDLVVTLGDPLCAPARCDGDPGCDPTTLECRGFVGCLLWCLLVDQGDDCEDICAGAEPSQGAIERFEALGTCLEGADCDDGPHGAVCQAAACGAEIEACVGDIGRIWFVRPPNPGGAVRCDYPFDASDDCGGREQSCRRGECVDAASPCEPDPCAVRPERRCDGPEIVRTSAPVCAVEDGEAVCTYDEGRSPCEVPPARCERDLLVESRNPRCVDDAQGVYCTQDEAVTICDADPPANCDGNSVSTRDPGRCQAAGDAVACVPGEPRRIDCGRDSVCADGACVQSACDLTCEARNIRGCNALQAPLLAPCGRDRICADGACADIPAIHGSACRAAEDTAACERAGLTCRGLAAVPQCLLGDSPRTTRDTCWTTADCDRGLICTRYGLCSTGVRGSDCETSMDCQPESFCQRGGCQ